MHKTCYNLVTHVHVTLMIILLLTQGDHQDRSQPSFALKQDAACKVQAGESAIVVTSRGFEMIASAMTASKKVQHSQTAALIAV